MKPYKLMVFLWLMTVFRSRWNMLQIPMKSSIKLFLWLLVASLFVAAFRLRVAPPSVLLLLTPTFALFQLLWASGILSKYPPTHWLFKIPGLLWLRSALTAALGIPIWVRVLVLLACIFGGLALSKITTYALSLPST